MNVCTLGKSPIALEESTETRHRADDEDVANTIGSGEEMKKDKILLCCPGLKCLNVTLDLYDKPWTGQGVYDARKTLEMEQNLYDTPGEGQGVCVSK